MSRFEDVVKARIEAGIDKAALENEWADLAPRPEDISSRSEEDALLDAAIKGFPILDAYRRWCGKEQETPRPGQVESIMVSCPLPDHADNEPSAWVNTQMNVGNCGVCEQGFDQYDIAAWAWSLDFRHDPKKFTALRKRIGLELGFQFAKGLSNKVYIVPPSEEPESKEVELPALLPSGAAQEAQDEEDEELSAIYSPISWRNWVPENTFLRSWLNANCHDDCPEEYHFWTGMMAISFALNRGISLYEEPNVYSNLFISFVGEPGSGKSKAKRKLDALLDMALPYDKDSASGVQSIDGAGSGEHLIARFVKPVIGEDNKSVVGYQPVTGLVSYGELAELVTKSSRQGSSLRTVLMEMADSVNKIGTGSQTSGALIAREAFAQVLTTVQPGVIRKLFQEDDIDSGFMSRWLFAPGLSTKIITPIVMPSPLNIQDSVDLLKQIKGYTGSFSQMTWADDGFKKYNQFYHLYIDPIKKSPGNKNLVVRIDLMCKKLLMIFAANNLSKTITENEIKLLQEIFPYIESTYGNLGHQLRSTILGDLRDKILRQIARLTSRNKKRPSKKAIYDSLGRSSYTDEQVIRTLKVMEEVGLIIEHAPEKGRPGRPSVTYGLAEES